MLPRLGAKIDEIEALRVKVDVAQLSENDHPDAARLFDEYEELNGLRRKEVLDVMSKHIAVVNAQREFKAAEQVYEAAADAYAAAYGGAPRDEAGSGSEAGSGDE